MANRLGKAVSHACYKNGEFQTSAKYLHNCKSAGGNNVKWKFEVYDESDELIGHVEVKLPTTFKGDESKQLKEILKMAKSKIN
jgi:hypothetical protein